MKLVLDGLEHPIDLMAGRASVLQVENQALFARTASSLMSEEGTCAVEPYSLWNGEIEIVAKGSMLFICNPFHLPWDDRALVGEVVKRIEREFLEDEDSRREIEQLQQVLSSKLALFSMGFNAEYSLDVEFDLKRSLKNMGFGVRPNPDDSLLDNLLSFLSLSLDAGLKKVLVFVNLKTFLTENELSRFYEHVFYTKMHVLLLENKRDGNSYNNELKYTVDLQFLES